MTVNNGARLDVAFGPYTGKAAVVTDGATEVAFFADFRGLRNVTTGTINGRPYRVISAERGDAERGLKGMVVLTVEQIGGGDA